MGAPPGTAGSVPMTPFRNFSNCRRSDCGGSAGRIYDALKAHSESWHVFMDFVLLSAVLCVLALLGRLLTREGAYRLASIAPGLVPFGFALNPAIDQKFQHLEVGDWLAPIGSIILVAGSARPSVSNLRPQEAPPEPSSTALR